VDTLRAQHPEVQAYTYYSHRWVPACTLRNKCMLRTAHEAL
jgi:hypothetical protein